jgi:FlaG/FlaF family flagellin (archaellin)
LGDPQKTFALSPIVMHSIHPVAILVSIVFILAGCASSTIAPVVDAQKATSISIGQTRAEIEKTLGASVNTFTYALRNDVRFQAWPFYELATQKCLLITYDSNDRAIDAAILIKDRGSFAMPLPGACF